MKIIVMLLWIGFANGGPTTIQGFDSLESCKSQIEEVSKDWAKIMLTPYQVDCFELNK